MIIYWRNYYNMLITAVSAKVLLQNGLVVIINNSRAGGSVSGWLRLAMIEPATLCESDEILSDYRSRQMQQMFWVSGNSTRGFQL